MLTRQAFLLHYKALAEYAELRSMVIQNLEEKEIIDLVPLNQTQAEYIWHFVRPYVCVIHRSTGRGYYLDRNYRLIVSVQDIPNPSGKEAGVPAPLQRCITHETRLKFQPASHTMPDWAEQLPVEFFDTYWLY